MEKEIVFLGDSITAWNNLENIKKLRKIENYAVSGYTTLDILWGLEERNIEGEIVVLMIGVNDILNGYSTEKICKNIEKIIMKLREKFTKILLISILPTMYKDLNKKIEEINKFLDEIHKNNLQINKLFLNENGSLDNKYSADGVHLSPEGYKLLNEKLCEKLEKL